MRRRAGEAVVAAHRIVGEAEILEGVGDAPRDAVGQPRGRHDLDAEMAARIRIDRAEGGAALVAQVEQLVRHPRVGEHRVQRHRPEPPTPADLHRGRGLRVEIGGAEGVGRQCRVAGVRPARAAVRRSVDGGDQVVMGRRLEAAADRGEEKLILRRAPGEREARADAEIVAVMARVLEGHGAVRHPHLRVERAERDRRRRGGCSRRRSPSVAAERSLRPKTGPGSPRRVAA